MARCGCGSGCGCSLVAGDGTTVTGSGTPANPWIVSSVVNCADVRGCLSAGCGTTYNPTTGAISADISEDANNALQCRPNGLYVQTGAATVTAGCGLTGNGSPATPVRANTGTWPYTCDITANSTVVACDPATGQLRGEPPVKQAFFQDALNEMLATPLVVPGAADQVIRNVSLSVTNPDPCRDALIMTWFDVDCDLDLPPNSGGMYGMDGDDLVYFGNTGSGTVFSTHAQSGKMTRVTIPAGATIAINRTVNAGRGTGGATIRRIQWALRAWVYSMPQ